MKQNALRTVILIGLLAFALIWTIIMGLGVAANSLTSDSAGTVTASQFGAGAHVMYVDESAFPEVTVYLAVNDQNGQPVLNLKQDRFTLREDGKPVNITGFVPAGGGATTTLLVIDQSGSMGDEDKMAGAVEAAQTYVNLLQADTDSLGVIVFSDWPISLWPVSVVTEPGRATLNGLLGALFPLAGTEFYVATRDAIQNLKNTGGRKVVLALTDGMDNNGQSGLAETIDDAVAANVPIYTIGLGNSVDSEGLEQLAARTGGESYFSPSAAELTSLYQGIASGLRNEYAVTYSSLTPNLDGTQRALAVDISTSSGGMQTEGGYGVGGILASSLNLAIFVPTLLVLGFALLALFFIPSLPRRKADKGGAGHDLVADPIVPPPAAERPSPPIVQAQPPLNPPPLASPSPSPVPQPVVAPVVAPGVAPVVALAVAPAVAPIRLVVEYPVEGAGTVIGSAADCDLRLDDPTVAPHQARVLVADGRYVVEDLSGGGATKVSFTGDADNLRPIQKNALRDGSLIQAGNSLLRFKMVGNRVYLERMLPLAAAGAVIGTTAPCTVRLPGPAPMEVRLRHDGKYWQVERITGDCRVSFSGDPNQLRPVQERNAVKPGSLMQLGAVTVRLEE